MTRDEAAQEIKLRYAEYLRPAKKKGFICPVPNCGNGTGEDGDGITANPNKPGQLKCWKCGFSGDIVDLYQQEHGCDAKTAFSELYKFFGITIDPPTAPRKPAEARNNERTVIMQEDMKKPAEAATEATAGKQDFTDYYKYCKEHIDEQEYFSYVRGIGPEVAARYWLGYDPATRFVIVPVTTSFYIARNTDRTSKIRYKNPKGASIELFNTKALYNDTARPVFVTEGAIDALSIIEAGGEALALNSAVNTRKLLEQISKQKPSGTLILCLDGDDAGKSATATLVEGLRELNIPFVTADICGEYKDPNDALMGDRAVFVKAVKTEEKKILFPGLLTSARAQTILEEVDDHYLEMPNFPKLSSMVKIKKHDTVVIAADTGAGKSSLALNMLHELHDGYPAMYFNLEMDEATVIQRLVAIRTGMELDQIEGYKHDQRTREKVNEAIEGLSNGREIQLLNDVYDIEEIEKQIQKATKDRTEPTLVFVDTGLLVTTAGKTLSRYERFTQISEKLRRISRLNNIIMFVLLQQNREGKKEEKKEPTNSSLKESGSWENDATKILFLWLNPNTKNKEIAITKNRSGKTGSITLNYSPHTQTYKEAKEGFTEYHGKTPFDDMSVARKR